LPSSLRIAWFASSRRARYQTFLAHRRRTCTIGRRIALGRRTHLSRGGRCTHTWDTPGALAGASLFSVIVALAHNDAHDGMALDSMNKRRGVSELFVKTWHGASRLVVAACVFDMYNDRRAGQT